MSDKHRPDADEDDLDDLTALSEPQRLLPPRHESLLQLPQCAALTRSNERCSNSVVAGAAFCRIHGGGVAANRRATQERLLTCVGPAIDVLMEAMQQADWPIAVKAATAILDRAGIGPHQHITVNEDTSDLDRMTDQDLERRALTLANVVRMRRIAAEAALTAPSEPQLGGNDDGITHPSEAYANDKKVH